MRNSETTNQRINETAKPKQIYFRVQQFEIRLCMAAADGRGWIDA